MLSAKLTGAAVMALVVAVCSGCGGGADRQDVSPVAGMKPIGAGAGAAPAVAETLTAVSDPSVLPPFDLPVAGDTVRITASAQPARPAKIALSLRERPGPGTIAAVAVKERSSAPWEVVVGRLPASRRAVVFAAPHFSWFTPLLLDLKALVAEVREQVDGLTSGATAEAKAPSCADERGARADGWRVRSKGAGTIRWCFGRRDGQRFVTLVNARRYPLSIAHPGSRVLVPPKLGPTDLSSLSAKVSPRVTSLPPRASVTYAVDGDAVFRAEFDGLAQSLYQLQVGVETAVTLWTRFGADRKGAAKKLVAGLMESASCAGVLADPGNGGTIIRRCLGDAKRLADELGWKGAVLAAVMTSGTLVEFFRSELNGLGDVIRSRDRYELWVTRPVVPVLGVSDFLLYGDGWGEVAPVRVFNGGVPSGMVRDITWRDWGAASAYGTGLTSLYRPEGGYYAQSATAELEATRLGRCQGSDRVAYTRLLVRVPDVPGGPLGEPRPWTLDLCDADQRPSQCGQIGFSPNSEDGVFRITTWDTDCATAKKLAKAIGERFSVASGSPEDLTEYEARSDGFTCAGFSFDSDPLPTIDWTCYRRTAQVTFERS